MIAEAVVVMIVPTVNHVEPEVEKVVSLIEVARVIEVALDLALVAWNLLLT